jgi:4-hydroxy-3-methylbut-2-enyl diphosphate reductase
VAERAGCRYSVLLQRAADIDWSKFQDIKTLGVTAGASAPEVLVEEILGAFAERYTLDVETVSGADESGMFFPLPRHLREATAAS